MRGSASAGVYGLAALLHDQFFAYSIDMSTAAEEVPGTRPHCLTLVARCIFCEK